MSIFTIYMGQRGVDGDDGDDGISIGDTREYSVNNPLMHGFSTNQLSTNTLINYSADGNCSYVDRYGDYVWSKKSEYTNFCPFSNDFSQWVDVSGLFTYTGTTADPDGGNDASIIQLDSDTRELTNGVAALTVPNIVAGNIYTISFWVKVISGAVNSINLSLGLPENDDRVALLNPSSEWTKISYQISRQSVDIIWISPKGDAGAEIALYGVSISDTLYDVELLPTSGVKKSGSYEFDVYRYSNLGFLMEEAGENLIHHSSDLTFWEKVDCDSIRSESQDIFGYKNKINTLSSTDSSEISISTSTGILADTQQYTVSFFAKAPTGTSARISIAGGAEEEILELPTTTDKRVSVVCTAGSDVSGIEITFTNDSELYDLTVQYFQIELGDMTSPILTGGNTELRFESNSSASYSYNAPKPDGPWSFMFKQSGVDSDAGTKTVFSNAESGVNEFSLSFIGSLLTLNMGGNASSIEWAGNNEYVITYDGANVNFYNGTELIKTQASASTAHIANTIYFGYNGTDNYINAYLSNATFYNTALSDEDLKYLIGDK